MPADTAHVFVCSHSSRDERCACGPPLVAALRRAVDAHFGDLQVPPASSSSKSSARGKAAGSAAAGGAAAKRDDSAAVAAAAKAGLSSSGLSAVHVWACSHVGGHAFAGNAVAHPAGHWFGRVQPAHAATLVRELAALRGSKNAAAAAASSSSAAAAFSSPAAAVVPADPLAAAFWRDHWRGALGMTKDEQLALHARFAAAAGALPTQ